MTHPGRVERVLAVGRAFLAVTGLVAIYLDPTEPTRLQAVTYGMLLSYAVYSLCLLAYLQRATHVRQLHARIIHGVDIVWTSALTFASEGPVRPLFVFFLFVLLAAAYRGGFRATIATAVILVAVFLGETALAAGGAFGFELNRVILRVAYLLMTGALLGYLAEQDKRSRAELAAIAEVTRQPRVNLGLGGSVSAVGAAGRRGARRRIDAGRWRPRRADLHRRVHVCLRPVRSSALPLPTTTPSFATGCVACSKAKRASRWWVSAPTASKPFA